MTAERAQNGSCLSYPPDDTPCSRPYPQLCPLRSIRKWRAGVLFVGGICFSPISLQPILPYILLTLTSDQTPINQTIIVLYTTMG